MSLPVIAVAVTEENPLAGAAWVRELRKHGFTVRYPPEAETWLLRRQFGEEAPATMAGPDPHSWWGEARLLVVPAVTPDVLPLCARTIGEGLPLAAPATAETERFLGGAYLPIPEVPNAEAVRAHLAHLEADPALGEALLRKAAAQARRFSRLAGAPTHTPEAITPPLRWHGEQLPVLEPEWVEARGELPPLPVLGVTVLIPTRGGPRVARCLRALRAAAGETPLQVVLIVTGGLSGSLPPCDDVVRCEPPFAWTKANNAGLRVARYPLVLLLNDDCYFLRAGDLARLEERLRLCGHLVAVAPRGEGFPAHWEQYRLPASMGLRPTRHTVSGACVLIRREAFSVVGAFDERFCTYGCEEIDWFYRARACGYRWAIDTDVTVDHERKGTFGPDIEVELRGSLALFRELHGVTAEDGPHWELARPAVSWVIASRDNAGHLARCLGSIAAHRASFPEPSEVILALDGCTDRSAEVARDFNASIEEPLPLRVIEFPQPAGTVSAAKNRALRLATGDVQLCMDDDDQVAVPRADLLPLLEQGDVAVGNFLTIGVGGSVLHRRTDPILLPRLLTPGAPNWGLWATAIRREVWEQHGLLRDDLPCTGDLELWLRWLREGVRFVHGDLTVHINLSRRGSVSDRLPTPAMRSGLQQAYAGGRGTPPLGFRGASIANPGPPASGAPIELPDPPASPFAIRHSPFALAAAPPPPWQQPDELARLVEIYRRLAPRYVLEIGSALGGTLWHWLREAPDGCRVVSVDLPWQGDDRRETFRRWARPGVELHCLAADSHAPETLAEVRRLLPQVDFLFLDGDHSYTGVQQDWEDYVPLVRTGGLVALHDIARTAADSPIEVWKWWEEVRPQVHWAEELLATPGATAYGIGVVYV